MGLVYIATIILMVKCKLSWIYCYFEWVSFISCSGKYQVPPSHSILYSLCYPAQALTPVSQPCKLLFFSSPDNEEGENLTL